MATHSNILAWKIPWTQEPGGREAIVHGVTKSQTQLSTQTSVKWGFPCGSDCKQSSCNAGDLGLIPGQGRSPGESNGYLLQYPWLENSTDRGAWQATVHGGHKESYMTKLLTHTHIYIYMIICIHLWVIYLHLCIHNMSQNSLYI